MVRVVTLTNAMLTDPSLPKGLPSGMLLEVLYEEEEEEEVRYNGH